MPLICFGKVPGEQVTVPVFNRTEHQANTLLAGVYYKRPQARNTRCCRQLDMDQSWNTLFIRLKFHKHSVHTYVPGMGDTPCFVATGQLYIEYKPPALTPAMLHDFLISCKRAFRRIKIKHTPCYLNTGQQAHGFTARSQQAKPFKYGDYSRQVKYS
jgi:hypothetical protein